MYFMLSKLQIHFPIYVHNTIPFNCTSYIKLVYLKSAKLEQLILYLIAL